MITWPPSIKKLRASVLNGNRVYFLRPVSYLGPILLEYTKLLWHSEMIACDCCSYKYLGEKGRNYELCPQSTNVSVSIYKKTLPSTTICAVQENARWRRSS